MEFITTGNRIAVENFVKGNVYTITFTSGDYIVASCVGIGSNFVMFISSVAPKLFSLTMETASTVSEIELYAGGGGTYNYEDLTNPTRLTSREYRRTGT